VWRHNDGRDAIMFHAPEVTSDTGKFFLAISLVSNSYVSQVSQFVSLSVYHQESVFGTVCGIVNKCISLPVGAQDPKKEYIDIMTGVVFTLLAAVSEPLRSLLLT